MSEDCPIHGVRALRSKTRTVGICDKFFVGLVLYTLVRTSEALAPEQAPISFTPSRPDGSELRPTASVTAFMPTTALATPPFQTPTLDTPSLSLPDAFRLPTLREEPGYSTSEFRPHGPSLRMTQTRGDDPPMLRNTTVWQRMKDYRSRDRVRVLTLWESGGGTVSLQAGRKGDPSLQWTSRFMNRGGATRGLLDQLFAASIAGASNSLRSSSHTADQRLGSAPVRSLDTRVMETRPRDK